MIESLCKGIQGGGTLGSIQNNRFRFFKVLLRQARQVIQCFDQPRLNSLCTCQQEWDFRSDLLWFLSCNAGISLQEGSIPDGTRAASVEHPMPGGSSHGILQMVRESVTIRFERVERCQPVCFVDDVWTRIFPWSNILLLQAFVHGLPNSP